MNIMIILHQTQPQGTHRRVGCFYLVPLYVLQSGCRTPECLHLNPWLGCAFRSYDSAPQVPPSSGSSAYEHLIYLNVMEACLSDTICNFSKRCNCWVQRFFLQKLVCATRDAVHSTRKVVTSWTCSISKMPSPPKKKNQILFNLFDLFVCTFYRSTKVEEKSKEISASCQTSTRETSRGIMLKLYTGLWKAFSYEITKTKRKQFQSKKVYHVIEPGFREYLAWCR